MPQNKTRKLKVYVASEVRQWVEEVLSGGADSLGVELLADPKNCDVEVIGPSAAEVHSAMRAGRVPIAPQSAGVQDFDPVSESGNGFTYAQGDRWSLIDALVRARENRRFPYDWSNIVRAGAESAS